MKSTSDRVGKLLALERLYYMRALDQNMSRRNAALEAAWADVHGRGMQYSGPGAQALQAVERDFLDQLLAARLEIRRRMIEQAPELRSGEQFQNLEDEIKTEIEKLTTSIDERVAGRMPKLGPTGGGARIHHELESKFGLELGILRQEIELGVRLVGLPGSTVINIRESNVGAVNLGSVMGDVRSSIQALEVAGATSLETADAIKELAQALSDRHLNSLTKPLSDALICRKPRFCGLPRSMRSFRCCNAERCLRVNLSGFA